MSVTFTPMETFEDSEAFQTRFDDNSMQMCPEGHTWDLSDVSLHNNDPYVIEEYVMLNHLIIKVNKLIAYLKAKHSTDQRTKRLCSLWKGKIRRLVPSRTSEAAVTVDKSFISLCLRDHAYGTLHNENVAMFVVIHELAHMSNDQVGHGPEFWNNMRWLLLNAETCGIYHDAGFERNPVTFCGHAITGSPLTCFKMNKCTIS